MSECRRVLIKKMVQSEAQATAFIRLLSEASELVYPVERFSIIKKDEADNRILECAAAAGADFIVSGDKKHLLPLKRFQNTPILSCRQFCERVGIL